MRDILDSGYTFNAAARTLDFSATPNFVLSRLILVVNNTRESIIYAPGKPGLGYSAFANGVLTLKANTTSHANTDNLTLFYDRGDSLGPGEAHIGQVGGTTRVVTAFFNRPADVTAYAVNDLIGPSLTANDLANVMVFPAARILGGSGRIIRARAGTNDATCTAIIRAHLFKTAVAPAAGDNASLQNKIANYVNGYGWIDLQFSNGDTSLNIYSDGAKGYQAFMPAIAFDVTADTANIYAVLQARSAFTPKSGQRFSLTLEIDLD